MLQSNGFLKVCLFIFIPFIFCFSAAAENLVANNYKIGPGDVLDISVWKNGDLSKVVPVLPDGYISFPLVGKIKAAGKTLSQFENNLTEKIVKYIPNPSLFVVVKEAYIPIYVTGKVKKPGVYELQSNINVLQSLTLAGGLGKFADRNEIIIMREVSGRTELYKFLYDEVSKGERLDQNIILQRGDTVVVP